MFTHLPERKIENRLKTGDFLFFSRRCVAKSYLSEHDYGRRALLNKIPTAIIIIRFAFVK
jgi:hypothetical protein